MRSVCLIDNSFSKIFGFFLLWIWVQVRQSWRCLSCFLHEARRRWRSNDVPDGDVDYDDRDLDSLFGHYKDEYSAILIIWIQLSFLRQNRIGCVSCYITGNFYTRQKCINTTEEAEWFNNNDGAHWFTKEGQCRQINMFWDLILCIISVRNL